MNSRMEIFETLSENRAELLTQDVRWQFNPYKDESFFGCHAFS